MRATHDVPARIRRTSYVTVSADRKNLKSKGHRVISEDPVKPMRESPLPDGVIRVAVLETNRLVGEALTVLLNRAPDIRAIAEALSGREKALATGSPDVVLLNRGPENGSTLRVARDVKGNCPGARVIVRDLPAREELSEFLNAGVSGFIKTNANLDVALNTVRAVSAGLTVLPDRLTTAVFSDVTKEGVLPGGSRSYAWLSMTPREQEVSKLIAKGLSNKAIGKQLHISLHTVKSHVRNIMGKLDTHSRLQIATYVYQKADDGVEQALPRGGAGL